jgi:hypothetical protein
MRFNPIYLFYLSILLSQSTFAQKNKTQQALLQIKPLICVVRQLGEPCQMSVSIEWQNQIQIDACLYQEEKELRCWKQKDKVAEQLQITLAESMRFSLIDMQGSLLATQTVKVNAAMSKRYRRKLKTDWSFF